ncbi:uncharacterized protein LOC129593528 [Paramacrobiotus metropolitanus]|uniref:uncharacterized protein LOC129593528 n=1 Tax=Paramacrobiotus metropolitanus TaxID=2943436 RepID=UPI002446111A|nr:uncharacterized protein LOC129593528 [Paramacrobiotus metropolitanus]
MPSLSPFNDYAKLRPHFHTENRATVIEIGPASVVHRPHKDNYSTIPMQHKRADNSFVDWDAHPTSRPTSRADSTGSNVSLKDTVDVFVDNKFHKSYNINYEPVRIRIGDENDAAGSAYSGRISSTYSPAQSRPGTYDDNRSANASRSSYHSNTKETYTSNQPSSGSQVTINGSDSGINRNHAYSPKTMQGEYNIPIRREQHSNFEPRNSPSTTVLSDRSNHSQMPKKMAMGSEYSIPIQQEGARYDSSRGRTSIPIGGDSGNIPTAGRHTSVFSPDSGRASVELPLSRGGYVATPLPDTPIGGYSDIVINNLPESGRSEHGRRSRSSRSDSHNKKDHFAAGRHSVRFDDSSDSERAHGSGHVEPTSTYVRKSGYGEPTGTYVRDAAPQNKSPMRASNSDKYYPSSTDTYVRDERENVSLGDSKQISISKVDVGGAIVNSPSLTYAVDDSFARPSSRPVSRSGNTPIPPAPQDNMRSPSRTRSLSRGDSTGRPASRVGLPTYERDYLDRPGNEAELDDLSDEERNERLRQKKAIYPQSRNAALVAELKETTNNISASRRNRIEKEFTDKLEKKEFLAMLERLTAEQFMPQVPYYDEEGFQIAEYKRNFLAKQAANQARREFQARIDNGEDMNQIQQSPEWKRLFIDSAKDEYDGSLKFGMQNKEALQISLNKNRTGNKLQPWQLELKRLERFHN